jgi:hypothetical protein
MFSPARLPWIDPFSATCGVYVCLDAESARRLIAFRIDRPVQARIEMLGQRANEGSLNTFERSEYEALINAADFIAILKLKARRRLDQISR